MDPTGTLPVGGGGTQEASRRMKEEEMEEKQKTHMTLFAAVAGDAILGGGKAMLLVGMDDAGKLQVPTLIGRLKLVDERGMLLMEALKTRVEASNGMVGSPAFVVDLGEHPINGKVLVRGLWNGKEGRLVLRDIGIAYEGDLEEQRMAQLMWPDGTRGQVRLEAY